MCECSSQKTTEEDRKTGPSANTESVVDLIKWPMSVFTSCMYANTQKLTKVLKTLSLKLILSVYFVRKRGTYEVGDGQPADSISRPHGIPLSKFTVGIPKRHLATADEKMCKNKLINDPSVAVST